jgi:cytochrome c biogenesis protein CcmG, thiol:disulfide interchange protein DsbE
MNAKVFLVGLIIFAALCGVLFKAVMTANPTEIRSPLIGKTAPTFALRQAGTTQAVDITQFRGKPLVVNFWATWCGPCWEEHPVLVANARMLEGNVQFLGVVFQDKEEKILGFLQQRGSSYPTVVDEAGKTAIAYGVGGVPETFFIDANGVIQAKFSGPLSPDQLRENLQKVMR